MAGRRAARIDGNQNAVVEKLRRLGITVAITSALGDGFPDLVVGWRGRNVLIELKDPAQPESKRKLTEDEKKFRDNWRGEVYTALNAGDVLHILGYVFYGEI